MVVTRFQVMALLQAARAFVLGMPEYMAKSWGLNRAIFFAAAKRGFKGRSELTSEFRMARKGEVDVFKLGDEMALKEEMDGKTYFTIGGKVQTELDFKRQVESRFGSSFDDAWKEALKIVASYDRSVLLSQNDFYRRVYLPRRDELVKRWTEMSLTRLATKKESSSKEGE